jgi:hypothetical protein
VVLALGRLVEKDNAEALRLGLCALAGTVFWVAVLS